MNSAGNFPGNNLYANEENDWRYSNNGNSTNFDSLDVLDPVSEENMLNQIYTNITQKCLMKKPYMEPKESFKKIIQDPSVTEDVKYSDEKMVQLFKELDFLPWNNLRDFSLKYTGNYDWFGVVTDRMGTIKHLVPFETKDEPSGFNSYLVSLNLINHYKYNVSDYQAFKGAKEKILSHIELVKILTTEPDPNSKEPTIKTRTKETTLADSLSLINTSSAFSKYKHSWGLLQLWIMHVFEMACGCSILIDQTSLRELKRKFDTEDNQRQEKEFEKNATKNINKCSSSQRSSHSFQKNNGSSSAAQGRENLYSSTGDNKKKRTYLSAPPIEFLLVKPSGSNFFGASLAMDEPNIKITDYELMINPQQNVLSPDFCEAEKKLTSANIDDLDYDGNILNIVNLPRNKCFEILEKQLQTLVSSHKKLEDKLKDVETKLFSEKTKGNSGRYNNVVDLKQQRIELIKTINKLSLKINSCVLAQNYDSVFDNYTKVMLAPELANFLYRQELKEQQKKKQRQLSNEDQRLESQTGQQASESGTSRSQSFQHLNQTNISALTENFTKSSIITKIPFMDNSFHYISIPGIWDTIPYKKWEPLAREVYRVLKPGGMLYSVVLDFKPKNLHSAAMSEFKTSREKEDIFNKVILQSTRSGHQLAPSQYLTQVLYKVGFKTVNYTYLSVKLGDLQTDLGKNNELLFFILFMLFFMNMGQNEKLKDIDTFAERYMKEHDQRIDTKNGATRILIAKAYKA